jgi:predicted kinase
MERKLYVLVGIPGSGKTTWVNNQPWAKDCAYISTDIYVEKFAKKLGKTYDDVFQQVMPRCVRLMMRAVDKAEREGKDIIWDQTNVSVYSRLKKLRRLRNYYSIAVVFPTPNRQELSRRLMSRDGKHIPENVIRSMKKNFVFPTKDEGFNDIWIVQ